MLRALVAALALTLVATHAQAQPFDPAFRFRTIETAHFSVHFHQDEDALAQRVAVLAEAAHEALVPVIGHEPTERTHITLVDDDDDANGFASPLPYNGIQLLAAAPDSRGELNRFEDWVWQLVAHEYTHVLHLDTISGPARVGNVLIGKQLSPNMTWPRWFIEGWAVMQESRLSRGGRLRSAYQEMQLRAQVLEGRTLSLEALSSPPLEWPRRAAWYLYGGRFVEFIAAKAGASAVRGMSVDNGGMLIPYLLGTISQHHAGKPFTALYEEWIESLGNRYRSELEARGPTSPERRLTETGELRQSPRPSRDGRFVYSVVRDGHRLARVVAYDVARGTERDVATLNGAGTLAVNTDGSLLVSQPDVWNQFRSYDDLFSLDPSTGRFEKLTSGARLSDPDVSRDGRIAAIQRVGPGRTALVLFASLDDLRAGRSRTLAEGTGWHPVATPRFSPAGTRLAFVQHTDTAYDLNVVELATGRITSLTHDAAQDLEPAFSNDGKHLYFSSDRDGFFDVYEHDFSTGVTQRRTRLTTGAFEPFELDGRLWYLGYSARGYDLAMQPEAFAQEAPSSPDEPAGPRPPASSDMPLPSHPYRLSMLRPTWWLPVISNDPQGLVLGASLGGSDVVQNVTYAASLFYSLGSHEPGFALSVREDATWPALTASASRSLEYAPGAPKGYVERNTSTRIGTSWQFRQPLSSVRMDAAWQASWLEAAVIPPDARFLPASGRVASASLSFSYAGALRFDRAISAEEGRRLSLDLRISAPWTGSEYRFTTASASWTEYVRLPWSRHHVLALRGAGGMGVGELGRRRLFALGGTELSSVLSDLIALQSPTRVLRGYAPASFSGSAWWLATAEYRFPIAAPEFGVGTWPVALRRVHGAAFVDAGDAFAPARGTTPRVGVGGELRLEWTLGYALPVDLRVGYAHGLSASGGPQLLLLVGSAF